MVIDVQIQAWCILYVQKSKVSNYKMKEKTMSTCMVTIRTFFNSGFLAVGVLWRESIINCDIYVS